MRTAREGGLVLRLRIVASRVEPEIESDRPVQACRLLEGRPPQEAVDLLPKIFALCGTAQTHAGLTALEGALGLVPAPGHRAARRLLLLAETAREHAWRLLLDWPGLIGEPPGAAAFRPVLAAATRLPGLLYESGGWAVLGGGALAPGRAALAEAVEAFGSAVRAAVGLPPAIADEEGFLAWMRAGQPPPARVLHAALGRGWARSGAGGPPGLPWLPEPELDAALAADRDGEMARTPAWQGAVFETGPLVRQSGHPILSGLVARYGNGLLPRLAARLVELAGLPGPMAALLPEIAPTGPAVGGSASPPGAGLVQMEMARGRLVHRVELVDGAVARYQVVAPTEWNFHPAGPLARALRGLPLADGDILSEQARWLAVALDPCVDFSVVAETGGG